MTENTQKGCIFTTFLATFMYICSIECYSICMKYLNIKKALAAWQGLQPLSEKDRERLRRRFTVDFNYNSNHIEGNTMTYGQTEILLLFGKVIGEADVHDVQEMTASNIGLRMMSEEAAMKETEDALDALFSWWAGEISTEEYEEKSGAKITNK